MDAGKGNKNINEVLKVFGVLEENNFARDSTLIALGGGVVGDLSGFVASTWLRGMHLVQIPTTLMGMVDSSVGGKVAINFRRTINAIGNYYHPILNLMDLDFVDSLTDRDFCSGMAEVIKCGIIADEALIEFLEESKNSILSRDDSSVVHCIARALEIKISHVQGDTREGGKRLLLNFGHTLGHAVEISTEKNQHEQLRHGEGVALGVVAVVSIAETYLSAPRSFYQRIDNLFQIYGLPRTVRAQDLGFMREDLQAACLENVMKDKKRLNNGLRLILAERLGAAKVYSEVPFELVEDAFRKIIV
jgi:3-dehydroquinate synthase